MDIHDPKRRPGETLPRYRARMAASQAITRRARTGASTTRDDIAVRREVLIQRSERAERDRLEAQQLGRSSTDAASEHQLRTGEIVQPQPAGWTGEPTE